MFGWALRPRLHRHRYDRHFGTRLLCRVCFREEVLSGILEDIREDVYPLLRSLVGSLGSARGSDLERRRNADD